MFTTKLQPTGEMLLTGRLDASETDEANAHFEKIAITTVLDFKELDYISSAGLALLIKHQKRLNALGHTLKVKNLNKHIRDVFMFTGFDRIFEIV